MSSIFCKYSFFSSLFFFVEVIQFTNLTSFHNILRVVVLTFTLDIPKHNTIFGPKKNLELVFPTTPWWFCLT